MTTTTRCPSCGTPLSANAPEGLCPKCLLGAGLQNEFGSPGTAETSPSPAANRSFVPPTPDELAKRFPQLEIIELIGQGGMGAVYKARQRDLDRLVALKILPPEVGSDPAFAERFNREARALAKLSHANIVGVYDSGKAGDLYYLMMEYIDGVNLRQAMQAGSITPEEAVGIVPQICDALQYAHDEGVVHRDIKPENVLVDAKGRVKIADFGLAKLLQHESTDLTLTHSQQVMGTPHYMAPEQMTASHDVDHRADIYSLGVVFYELLTGEVPMGRFDPPSKRVQVDVRLDEIVLRTLDREPDRRYQRASEIKTDMETLHSQPAALPPKPDVSTDMGGDDLNEVRSEVKVPAIGLLAVGVLTLFSGIPMVLGLVAIATLWLAQVSYDEEPWIEDSATESVSGDYSASGYETVSSEGGSHMSAAANSEVVDESVVMDENDAAAAEAVSGPRRSLPQRVTDEIRENLSRARSENLSGPEGFYEDPREADEFDFSDAEPTTEYDPGSPAEAAAEYSSVGIGPMLIVVICVVVFLAIPVFVGGVITLGGWRMMQLRSHGWATMSAILALLPCHPAWLLGLIFGIWSLIVLNRPHVKAAFEEQI